MRLPLDGLTVVAVEQAVAAPLATRHLADAGARVIKVERVAGGDFARQYDRKVRGMSSHFAWLNRNKESIATDLTTEAGKEILRRLLADADVFVYNLAPGAMARLGFPVDHLRATYPRLIVAELTGYGDAGPLRDRKAYDMLIQAEAGLVSITGSEDTPSKSGIPVADIAAGGYLVQGVLTALIERGRTGSGTALRVSMFDAMVEWMGYPIYYTLFGGTQPRRFGLAHPTVVPYDAYPTADGAHVIIAVQNDAGWRALATRVLDRPDLVDDPKFATNVARTQNRREVDRIVAERTVRSTAEELLDALDRAGVAGGQVKDVAAVIAHPQLVARDRWTTVDSPVGRIEAVLPPLAPSPEMARMDPIPALGEHSAAILSELGYDEAERDRFRAEGAVA
ncbi:CaiB/BaiF CoA transferase family protein [Rhizomonospora bruguierae]|uniref:CaiB/BaiF CoA transferase family protein n=1 Tax=Rhizomonospora bruguierae TaxID=1581705 RepID=UPI001BD04F33|nr:CaiB/BaiF CoA-transferase family protein [Micromonospora sp. NBRC 107566]